MTPRETIDVTPHPRLLSVLGDIEFASWQCLAELVDNAFDDFIAHPPADGETPLVAITLPAKHSDPQDAQVWISDNGRGMSREHLRGALSAGWTTNARYGKLGLFGMGFNIATARLGKVTRVRTTRAGDPHWLSVTLDLQQMERAKSFEVPITVEPKDDPGYHGTEIVIGGLRPELHDALSRQRTKIRNVLGDIYSYLLREKGFTLTVDSTAVEPYRPCVWGKDRFVVVGRERYPAYLPIDKKLTSLAACMNCGRWQALGTKVCEECGSDQLEERERRIWGWLGIQRYTHKTDFGIDFLRNGRKILVRDVQLFAWTDPSEPGARPVVEYPIEVPYDGRIVGEIHVDHVRVNYQKNAFEYDTLEWKTVVRQLRGEGPLRPKIARDMGYSANISPIGRLFTGYRETKPGLARLMPGDGKNALREKAREWAVLFRKGEPEYQDDSKWYEAARQHDEPPKVDIPPEYTEREGAETGARSRLSIPDPDPASSSASDAAPVVRETEDEKQARYRAAGSVLVDISGKYSVPGYSTIEATVYEVSGTELVDSFGQPVPVYVQAQRGGAVDVWIDLGHTLFTDFGGDPREYAVLGIAEHLRVRQGTNVALSALVADLKEHCLADQRVTPSALAEVAHSLLDRVRAAMLPIVAGNSEGYWALTPGDEQAAAERRFAEEGADMQWASVRAEGEWVLYSSAASLGTLVRLRPGDFFDGRVFRISYSTFEDQHARALAVTRISGLLSDVGALSERRARSRPDDLNRGRLSCRILENELADSDGDG